MENIYKFATTAINTSKLTKQLHELVPKH